MSAYVSLEEIKAHANVEGDVTDAMLTLYLASAEQAAANFLDRSLASLLTDEDPDTFPAPVKHAILLYVTDAIEQRGTQIVGTINSELPTARRLLDPYRLLLGV